MYLPTATPPVKVTRSMSGLVSISSAISLGSPVTTENISGGRPASYRMSASTRAVSGVFSVGFNTIRLLVAIDGAILCATWFSGWLNGVMAEMTPCSGSRSVYTLRDLPWGVRSHEKICPSSLSAALPAKVNTSHARPTS